MEVASSSLAYDRLEKGSLYAQAGVSQYWIVNLVDFVLEVYDEPRRDPSNPYGWSYANFSITQDAKFGEKSFVADEFFMDLPRP